MSFLYRSERIGKHGKVFTLYKIRTLKENAGTFPKYKEKEEYTRYGRFLRKTKLDEIPQLLNVLKRDLNVVGPRPEEKKTISVLPKDIRDILLSRRPGLTSLASLHFFNEGQILEQSHDPHKDYWEKIKPLKILLDVFYVQNRSVLLDSAIVYGTIKKIVWSLITRR
jgi:lipopolysaccharide/colanic/teichoic acid biosynthesis glycosyltransferase